MGKTLAEEARELRAALEGLWGPIRDALRVIFLGTPPDGPAAPGGPPPVGYTPTCEWRGSLAEECGRRAEGVIPGLALTLCGTHLEEWNARARASRRARLEDGDG